MFLKCLIIPTSISNVILRENFLSYLCSRYHTRHSSIFCSLAIIEKKDVIGEFSETVYENPATTVSTKDKLLQNKSNVFQKLMFKLYHYSQLSKDSSTANTFIHNIDPNGSTCSKVWEDLNEFFYEQNDHVGLRMVQEIHLCNKHEEELDLLFLATDAWMKGNILASLQIFSLLYTNGDLSMKESIIKRAQGLAFNSITKKGKAIAQDVIKGAKTFTEETDEPRLMVTVWYSLFTSEWYSDRCSADNILNENKQLQLYLEKHISWIGFLFLKNHEVSNYQRIIETALKFNMEKSICLLLQALFDYYYKAGYFRGCSAVFKCCQDLDVELTQAQIYKYKMMKQSGDERKSIALHICTPKELKYKF